MYMIRIKLISILVLCIQIWASLASADTDNRLLQKEDEIKLTFLGTGSPRPSTKRYGPAILVEAGELKLLVDAGSGVRERLFEAGGFDLLTSIDKVLVTHLHFDHTISLPGLWLSGWLYGRRVPFEVYGPLGTHSMMSKFEQAYEWDIKYREIVGVPLEGSSVKAFDVKHGVFFDKNELKITAFPVEHMPINPANGELVEFDGETIGFRIDYKNRSVVFSGDTRSTPKSQLLKYGKDVDVLVHEVQVPSPGNSEEAKRANVSLSVHSTPKQAGYIFNNTNPGMAVYSHIIPAHTTASELIEATRDFYKGPMIVAHDFMTLTIGEKIVIGDQVKLEDDVFEKSRVLEK
jgi:ribonuclease Z